MARVILGNHSAIVLPKAEESRIRQFYRDVLGCEVIRESDLKDDFRLGGNFYIGVLYEDENVALDQRGFSKAIFWDIHLSGVGPPSQLRILRRLDRVGSPARSSRRTSGRLRRTTAATPSPGRRRRAKLSCSG